jgi:hypothetical protein
MIMDKTIKMMKESGLFDSLVDNILKKGMSKDAVALALDAVFEADENLEYTFLNDIHEIGLNIIWKELCYGVEVYKEENLKEQETVEDLLKKIINLLESK